MFPLILRISSGSNLGKGTLTFILLPLPVHDSVSETSNALHHFPNPFPLNVQIRVTLTLLNGDLFTLSVQVLANFVTFSTATLSH